MTDKEIEILKQKFWEFGSIAWFDPNTDSYKPVHKIVPGDRVWTATIEGPEPCECVTFLNTTMYVCLDNCELGDFVVLKIID